MPTDMTQPLKFRLMWIPLLAIALVVVAYYFVEGCPSRELLEIWIPWLGIMLGVGAALFAAFWLAYRTQRPLIRAAVIGALLGVGLVGLYRALRVPGDPLARLPVGVQCGFSVIYAFVLLWRASRRKVLADWRAGR